MAKPPYSSSPGGHRNRSRSKRSWNHHNNNEQEFATVDDLAIAAQYAAAVVVTTTTSQNEKDDNISQNKSNEGKDDAAVMEECSVSESYGVGDDNEILLEEEEKQEPSDSITTKTKTTTTSNDVTGTTSDESHDRNKHEMEEGDGAATSKIEEAAENSNSSDDESVLDLSKELAYMQQDDVEEAGVDEDGISKDNELRGPKTKNEVVQDDDPSLVSEKLEADCRRLLNESAEGQASDANGGGQQQQRQRVLRVAGRVQHHMVEERTLIVQSNDSDQQQQQQQHHLNHHQPCGQYHTTTGALPEGTLLVLQMLPTGAEEGENGGGTGADIVPIGKIVEVFGPVSHPLYSIRLPPPPTLTQKVKIDPAASSDDQKTKTGENLGFPSSSSSDSRAAEKMNDSVVLSADNVDETKQEESPTTTTAQEVEKDAEPKLNVASIEVAVKDEEKQQNQKQNEEDTLPAVDDPWSSDGKYTAFIKSSSVKCNSPVNVYYFENDTSVKWIDPAAIFHLSGPGTDASNVYDEEVVNPAEMEYSDDEQEQAAKRGRRRGKHKKGSPHSGNHHHHQQQQRQQQQQQPSASSSNRNRNRGSYGRQNDYRRRHSRGSADGMNEHHHHQAPAGPPSGFHSATGGGPAHNLGTYQHPQHHGTQAPPASFHHNTGWQSSMPAGSTYLGGGTPQPASWPTSVSTPGRVAQYPPPPPPPPPQQPGPYFSGYANSVTGPPGSNHYNRAPAPAPPVLHQQQSRLPGIYAPNQQANSGAATSQPEESDTVYYNYS